MKLATFATTSSLLFGAALAAKAADTASDVINNLPTCAKDCIPAAFRSGNCESWDYDCACGHFGAVTLGLSKCVADNLDSGECTFADVESVGTLADACTDFTPSDIEGLRSELSSVIGSETINLSSFLGSKTSELASILPTESSLFGSFTSKFDSITSKLGDITTDISSDASATATETGTETATETGTDTTATVTRTTATTTRSTGSSDPTSTDAPGAGSVVTPMAWAGAAAVVAVLAL